MQATTPSTIRAELHSHSTFSDGAYSPEEVARLCADEGVSLWALTDHDTTAGCARAADAAVALGVEFLPGIEVSAYHGRSVHILGYGVDPESSELQAFSERRLKARVDRMRRMVERLDALGVAVGWEAVARIAGEGAMARPHLAQALVEAGHVGDRGQAFDLYLADGAPAYVATTWPSVPEAIDLIHAAGGAAVLAHPGIYGLDGAIDAWAGAGLDGIEAGHPKHTANDRERYTAHAERLGLLITASNDFHGPAHVGADGFGRLDLSVSRIVRLREVIEARRRR